MGWWCVVVGALRAELVCDGDGSRWMMDVGGRLKSRFEFFCNGHVPQFNPNWVKSLLH
jgi:hypothetical protein